MPALISSLKQQQQKQKINKGTKQKALFQPRSTPPIPPTFFSPLALNLIIVSLVADKTYLHSSYLAGGLATVLP